MTGAWEGGGNWIGQKSRQQRGGSKGERRQEEVEGRTGERQIRGRVRRRDRRGGRAPGASQPVCPGVLMQAWYTGREEQEG